MGGPTRDGTAKPISRDQISGANGDGERWKNVPEKYRKLKKTKNNNGDHEEEETLGEEAKAERQSRASCHETRSGKRERESP